MAMYVLNDFHGNSKLTEDAIRLIREIVKPGDVIIANGDIAGSRGPLMNNLADIYYRVIRSEIDESALYEEVWRLVGERISIPREWVREAAHFGIFRALLAERNAKFRELVSSEIVNAINETLAPLGAAAKECGATIYYLSGNGELVPFDFDTSNDISVEKTISPEGYYYNKLARAGHFDSFGIQFVPGAKLLPHPDGYVLLLSTYLLDKDESSIKMELESVGAFGREKVEIAKVIVHYPPMVAPLGASFGFWKCKEVDKRRIEALDNMLGLLQLRSGAELYFGHIHLGAGDQRMNQYPPFMGWNKTVGPKGCAQVTIKCIWVKPGEMIQI